MTRARPAPAQEWVKAAQQLAGSVRVAAVDCDAHKALCGRYDVKGFPTIKVFGEDKKAKPADYTGAREAGPIVAHAQSLLGASGGGSGLVAALEYSQVHSFLAGGGSTPSVLFMGAEGARSAPTWLSTLAVKYKDGKKKAVSFGFTADPAVAKRFGLPRPPPAVALLLPAPAGGEGDDGPLLLLFPRPVPASAAAAVKELKEWVDAAVASPPAGADAARAPHFPALPVPRKQAATAYAGLLSEETGQGACLGGGRGACVLALVDTGAPGGHWAALDALLGDAAKRYRNDPLSFAAVHCPGQPDFCAPLLKLRGDGAGGGGGVGGGEGLLPALLVLRPTGRRPRAALLPDAWPFDLPRLAAFLDAVLGGDARFVALPGGAVPALESDAVRDALSHEDL